MDAFSITDVDEEAALSTVTFFPHISSISLPYTLHTLTR